MDYLNNDVFSHRECSISACHSRICMAFTNVFMFALTDVIVERWPFSFLSVCDYSNAFGFRLIFSSRLTVTSRGRQTFIYTHRPQEEVSVSKHATNGSEISSSLLDRVGLSTHILHFLKSSKSETEKLED